MAQLYHTRAPRRWLIRIVFPFGILLLVSACHGKRAPQSGSLRGYDLNKIYRIPLPPEMDEISGLTWNAPDSSLLAIQDELGILYKIYPYRPGKIERWQFGPPGDYEDLSLVDGALYVLRSDGHIYKVLFDGSGNANTTIYPFPDKGNEFETLCYDETRKLLLMVCKDCEEDKKKVLSTFAFDPGALTFGLYPYNIDAKAIAEALGEKKIRFKPSAATFYPGTQQLYIISAINRVIVTVNPNGTIDEVVRLASGVFKQPEGIAFSPWGTLFISNERADIGSPELLIFPRTEPR